MKKNTATGKRAACGVLSLAACFFGAGPWAYALDYYTWIDQYGVTHLSEEAPAIGHAQRRHIDIPAPATRSQDPDADYYSISNQNRRMQAHRREREKLLAERQLELERIKLQREQIALQAYQSELIRQPNVVSGWREDPGTAYAEYRYLGDYGGYRGKSHRRGYGNRRHSGNGYGRAQVHGRRGRGSARSRSIGVTRPARPVGPGSRF
jgi:hypothetical protein